MAHVAIHHHTTLSTNYQLCLHSLVTRLRLTLVMVFMVFDVGDGGVVGGRYYTGGVASDNENNVGDEGDGDVIDGGGGGDGVEG